MVGYFAIKQKHTKWTLYTGMGMIAIEVITIIFTFKQIVWRKKRAHYQRREAAKKAQPRPVNDNMSDDSVLIDSASNAEN